MNYARLGRLRHIDLARGLCMLAVMWGHIMLEGLSNYVCYAFTMPAFFFLSGIVFRREKYPTFGSFLLHRATTLLLPYVIWSVLTWCWWIIDQKLRGQPLVNIWQPLLQTVLAQGSGGYLVHNVALWFVPCLFVVGVLYWSLSRLPNAAVILAGLLSWALGWLLLQPNPIMDFRTLPWSVDVAFCALPYYAAGNLMTRGDAMERLRAAVTNRRGIAACVWVCCTAVLVLGASFNGHCTMAQGIYGTSMLLYIPTSFFGIAALLLFSMLLDSLTQSDSMRFDNRCINALGVFGSRSFDVMAIHIPIMLIAARFVTRNSGMAFYAARELFRYTLPGFAVMLTLCVALLPVIDAVRRRLHTLSAKSLA